MEQEVVTTMTYISSGELNRAPGAAKGAARKGPVFITEYGKVRFVLLSAAHYGRMAGRKPTLAEALGMPGPYVEFEPERIKKWLADIKEGPVSRQHLPRGMKMISRHCQ